MACVATTFVWLPGREMECLRSNAHRGLMCWPRKLVSGSVGAASLAAGGVRHMCCPAAVPCAAGGGWPAQAQAISFPQWRTAQVRYICCAVCQPRCPRWSAVGIVAPSGTAAALLQLAVLSWSCCSCATHLRVLVMQLGIACLHSHRLPGVLWVVCAQCAWSHANARKAQ